MVPRRVLLEASGLALGSVLGAIGLARWGAEVSLVPPVRFGTGWPLGEYEALSRPPDPRYPVAERARQRGPRRRHRL